MDPTETLRYLLHDLAELYVEKDNKNWDHDQLRCDIVGHLESLSEWIKNGGFPPKFEFLGRIHTTDEKIDQFLHYRPNVKN
jgi:hypothetical protein